jgi:hypothetical protein
MIPRGIPIAQIDSNREADSKLVRLARKLGGQAYYATFGAYMSIVLKTWATGAREADRDHLEPVQAGVSALVAPHPTARGRSLACSGPRRRGRGRRLW